MKKINPWEKRIANILISLGFLFPILLILFIFSMQSYYIKGNLNLSFIQGIAGALITIFASTLYYFMLNTPLPKINNLKELTGFFLLIVVGYLGMYLSFGIIIIKLIISQTDKLKLIESPEIVFIIIPTGVFFLILFYRLLLYSKKIPSSNQNKKKNIRNPLNLFHLDLRIINAKLFYVNRLWLRTKHI